MSPDGLVNPPCLNSSTETKYQMKSGLFLNVVIGKSATILELLSGKDETLLIRRNTFLVLDLGLYVINGITGFDIEGDSLSREGFDENLGKENEQGQQK